MGGSQEEAHPKALPAQGRPSDESPFLLPPSRWAQDTAGADGTDLCLKKRSIWLETEVWKWPPAARTKVKVTRPVTVLHASAVVGVSHRPERSPGTCLLGPVPAL